MTHVAFATSAALASLTADDRLLADALAARGARVTPAVWTDEALRWDAFDAVVVRSTWDYSGQVASYLAWVDRVAETGVPLWNSPALLRWNADKRYLLELPRDGIPILPTEFLPPGTTEPLADVLARRGWDDVVVKPVQSAGAFGTWRTSRARAGADEGKARELEARGGVLVQPFLETIVADGEWSLVFFDGRFSHGVLKRPAGGDFRVQQKHGGSMRPAAPDPALVAQAQRALALAHPDAPGALYARVDGCVVDRTLVVMELELLEPELFARADPAAPGRFADAVLGRLAGA